jgi:hypothetical protein
MDEVSVTRTAQPSTKALVADEAFCAQVAALLFCDRGPIHDAFIGEPAEEVLEMVRWALSHEDDEGFDPAEILTAWARKRRRGAWSGRSPRRTQDSGDGTERLAVALAKMWTEHPESLAEAIRALEISRDANGQA